jgi:hypothetical protein
MVDDPGSPNAHEHKDDVVEPVSGWVHRWAAPVFLAVALFLLPWTVFLTWALPSRHVSDHWDLAWVGFDIALCVAVAATAVGVHRRAAWLQGVAAASGALLLADAWFDITLSSGGASRMGAVTEAAVSEIPLALLAFWIAADTARFFGRWRELTSRGGRRAPGRV